MPRVSMAGPAEGEKAEPADENRVWGHSADISVVERYDEGKAYFLELAPTMIRNSKSCLATECNI